MWNLGGREREVRIEEVRGGGRGMAGPLLQMRGSRHRLPLLNRPSLLLFLLCSFEKFLTEKRIPGLY